MTASAVKRRTERRARVILILLGLLLPTLSLVPFGSIWLWQQGYLIYWAAAACLIMLATLLLPAPPLPGRSARTREERLARRHRTAPSSASNSAGRRSKSRRWPTLKRMARNIDLDALDSWDALLDLGQKTIETVANRLHPGRSDPVWQFTPPEALAIIERVSRRLRMIAVEKVPFGDKHHRRRRR